MNYLVMILSVMVILLAGYFRIEDGAAPAILVLGSIIACVLIPFTISNIRKELSYNKRI